jgi:hypothetical protein
MIGAKAETVESREARAARWAAHVQAQTGRGETVATYCARAGLRVWQFRYWKKRLGPARAEAAGFVELPLPAEGRIAIEVGDLRVSVGCGFDTGTLRAVVAALRA